MAKLSKNNELEIPIILFEHSIIDFNGDLSWFVYGNEAFVAPTNYRERHKPIQPLCPAKFEKGKTILPQKVCDLLKLNENSNISIYVKYGKLTLRKHIFYPEMR